MGLISMCSLRSLTPPPKTARLQTLCYHHTHTQRALSGGCLGQWCDTDIRADTSTISQNKTSRDSFQYTGGPEERHCSCSRQSRHSDTLYTLFYITFPTEFLTLLHVSESETTLNVTAAPSRIRENGNITSENRYLMF